MRTFFGAVVGVLLPISFTGRLLLEHELHQNGVEPGTLPKACLQEFTDQLVADAKMRVRFTNEHWKSQAVETIERWAWFIAAVLQGRISPEDVDHSIFLILRKHGVQVAGQMKEPGR
jgi:hypothetical protein